MPITRSREKKFNEHSGSWYEKERHKNEQRNMKLFETPGWYYCDCDSFYRALFPEGSLQKEGDNADGKPNLIVLEDTGKTFDLGVDARGNKREKRIMRRYTVHDDLNKLEELRNISLQENSFMFLAPVSYYGKSRSSRNARFLHAIMIDLDYVGERELSNLLHQMEHKVLPYANYLVSSGTGLHVVYKLDQPIPLKPCYVAGLQILKRELTDRVWNAYTSAIDPEKKQVQGIFQGFRMVGSMTKLNGAIGKPKHKKAYEVVCFSHDATPPATISYLLSFIPKLRDKEGKASLDVLQQMTKESRKTTPIAEAKKKWPEWYENHVVKNEPCKGWLFGRAAYDRILEVIKNDVSVGHRYWCIFYLAVMANKCGVPYEELEDDAYGLLERFDSLSTEPGNRFTANDAAAALEAFEGGSASGKVRRYTQAFCERKAAVKYGEKMGHGNNPPEKRLPKKLSLAKARTIRDLNQEVKGTHWWDNGNRDGAPKKAIQVWEVAYKNPSFSIAAIARMAEVSRPTVYKWLAIDNWKKQYEQIMDLESDNKSHIEEEVKSQELIQNDCSISSADFDRDVLETVAKYPWKSLEEIAVMCHLSSSNDVLRIIGQNERLFNQISLGYRDSEYELAFISI